MKEKLSDMIITLLKNGYSVKEIAHNLNISKSTVYRYRKNYLDSEKKVENLRPGEYITKTKLYYYIKDKDKTDEEWKNIVKERKLKSIKINLKGIYNEELWFNNTPLIDACLEKIKRDSSNNLFSLTNIHSMKVNNIIKENTFALEAFYSSKIEGAYTTKRIAKNLITGKRKPKDKSEMMIYNNQKALEYGLNNINDLYSHEFIFKIHDIINSDCLRGQKYDHPEESDMYISAEKYSYRSDDGIGVYNSITGKLVHDCAPSYKIHYMMNELIEFMENNDLDPIISSAIIHFYFVYIHPFSDGNGRTARAIAYLYLIKNGHRLFENFSISFILEKFKQKYYKSILECEKDNLNLTYFIEYICVIYSMSIEEILSKFEIAYTTANIYEYCESKYILMNENHLHILKFIMNQKDFKLDIERYIKKNESKYYKKYKENYQLEIIKEFEYLKDNDILEEDGNIFSINRKFIINKDNCELI